VGAAVRAFPLQVGGTRRDVTALMRAVPGLLAKDGAEAVYAAALADGTSVALKIADGGDRARPVVMAEALRVAGVDPALVAFLDDAPVLGHGQPVGAVRALPLAG
jgi:L-asparaginase II